MTSDAAAHAHSHSSMSQMKKRRRRTLPMSFMLATLSVTTMLATGGSTSVAAAKEDARATNAVQRLRGAPSTSAHPIDEITTSRAHQNTMLQKGQEQLQRRALNEQDYESTKIPTSGDTVAIAEELASEREDSSSFLESHYNNNPFESTRDELGINVTELVAMKLTGAPSPSTPVVSLPSPTAPAASPSRPARPYTPTTSSTYHAGPSIFYGGSVGDDEWMPQNDDPPSGSYSGGGSHPYDKLNDPTYVREETDFREFLAFVGWYAFLIVCCLLPTVCAYYRRRRNARALRENLAGIQERLAEIERRREAEGGGLQMNLSGENRDQDWEFLEQMFGSNSTQAPNLNDASNALNDAMGDDANQRRRIMSDIMGHVGMASRVLDFMEREQRRKQERGRRLVATLKESSMIVQEEHLIEKKARVGNQCTTIVECPAEEDEEDGGDNEGDIELGDIANNDKNDDNDEVEDAAVNESVQKKETNETDDATPSEAAADNAKSTTEEKGNEHNNTNKVDVPCGDSPHTSSKKSACKTDEAEVVQAVAEDAAVPTAPPQDAGNTSFTSLYQVDDPYIDDSDDEGNQYSALSIPSPNLLNGETTRQVSATCAICLLQYHPGCYVSWSSNKECTHAFHRDCILMWLLKKDEPLCPCCRREFVLESELSGDDAQADSAVNGGSDAAIAATSPLGEQPQTANATINASTQQRQRVRYSNLPGSFSVGDIGTSRAGAPSSQATPSARLDSFSIRSL